MKIPIEQWHAVEPGVGAPLAPHGAVSALGVESHPRYKSTAGSTWCNIFAWDVSVLCGHEVPHWYDQRTGEPVAVGAGSEMRANDIASWMRDFGVGRGWKRLPRLAAEARAQAGELALAVWTNPNGIGHVAVLLGPDAIAQAGRSNFESGTIKQGFGSASTALEFFAVRR